MASKPQHGRDLTQGSIPRNLLCRLLQLLCNAGGRAKRRQVLLLRRRHGAFAVLEGTDRFQRLALGEKQPGLAIEGGLQSAEPLTNSGQLNARSIRSHATGEALQRRGTRPSTRADPRQSFCCQPRASNHATAGANATVRMKL